MNFPELTKTERRISLSTMIFDKYAPLDVEGLARIAEAGIKNIELLESPQQFNLSDMGSMRYIIDMCKKAGVRIAAYHSRFVITTGIESEAELGRLTDMCKRQIETLQEAGGDIWAPHAMYADDYVYGLYERLLKFVEGTKVKLAIENFDAAYPVYANNSFYWRLLGDVNYGKVKLAVDDFHRQAPKRGIKDRMEFLKKLDHPQLGILLNIGHVKDEKGVNPMTEEGGAAEVLRECADKLVHLHLHGIGKSGESCPPLCDDDTVRWEEIFKSLWEIGYKGYYNFAVPGLPGFDDSINKVAAMQKVILRANTGK